MSTYYYILIWFVGNFLAYCRLIAHFYSIDEECIITREPRNNENIAVIAALAGSWITLISFIVIGCIDNDKYFFKISKHKLRKRYKMIICDKAMQLTSEIPNNGIGSRRLSFNDYYRMML